MTNHDGKGRFAPGNAAALIHGGRSRQVQEGQFGALAEAVAAMAEAHAEIATDLGNDLTRLQRDTLVDYRRVALVADFAFNAIQAGGIFTSHGRQRAIVGTFFKAVAQKPALAQVLGRERKKKQVDLDAGPISAACIKAGDRADGERVDECRGVEAIAFEFRGCHERSV